MNNKYEIEVKHPLVRPGLTIKTEVSEKYVLPALEKIMEIVREFNKRQEGALGINELWDVGKRIGL